MQSSAEEASGTREGKATAAEDSGAKAAGAAALPETALRNFIEDEPSLI